jgi:hypothetical protein
MRRFAYVAAYAVLACLPLPATAQEAAAPPPEPPALTRANVEAFYIESDALQIASPASYARFIAEHARADATFAVEMTAPGPDGAPTPRTMRFTKPQIVLMLQQAATDPSYRPVAARTDVMNLEIGPDGLARAQVSQSSEGMVSGSEGQVRICVRARCADVFAPSAATGLAYVSSDCTATMTEVAGDNPCPPTSTPVKPAAISDTDAPQDTPQ